MKKLHTLAAAAVLGAMSISAQAESNWSAQYSMYDFDGGASPAAVEVSYGMGVADNISVEGYVGMGVGDDDGTEVALTYGAEGMYSYELSDGLSIHGLLGFAYTEIEVDLGGAFGTVEDDDSALAIGIGGAFEAGPGSIILQYRSIDYDVDTTVVDVGYKMEI